jgi:hypothetical protein
VVRKAADALDFQTLRDDVAKLRQEVLARSRADRGGHQQDAQQEVLAWKSACAAFLALPGLRGFWPMSSFNEAGNAYDLSGQGRTLTYNGNPTYNYDGLAPYIDLDGTGDYLSRADEAGLDILGTEAYVAAAAQGLTLGGWFWVDSQDDFDVVVSKWAGAGARSYQLRMGPAANAKTRFIISNDGTASVECGNPPNGTLTYGEWHFIVGRFIPSTEVAQYFDGVFYKNAASIPASVFNSAAQFVVGGTSGGGHLMDGRASLVFLCAVSLSDAMIHALYHQTRGLFRKW